MVFVVAVTPQRELVAQRIGGTRYVADGGPGAALTPEQVLRSTQFLIGTEDQIVEALLARRERLGISCIQVIEKDLAAFALIIARLTGK